MKDLIERLERASGPDKILDCDIRAAVEGWRNVGGGYREWPDGRRERYNYGFAEPYTASLDSALTLVPEGWWLTGCGEQRTQIIYVKDRHEPTGFFYAKVQHIKGGRLQVASARSIAIALCIAALKARVRLRGASEQEAVSPEGADGPQHMEACRG